MYTGSETDTYWVAVKNKRTNMAADMTATGFTVSECLSYCEQGFPTGCKSVVYDSTTEVSQSSTTAPLR